MGNMICAQQYPILRGQYFFEGVLRNTLVIQRVKGTGENLSGIIIVI